MTCRREVNRPGGHGSGGDGRLRADRRGLTLYELMISLIVVLILLATIMPSLAVARRQGKREKCANNLRRFAYVWDEWLIENDQEFPHVPVQPGWRYGGVRFSATDDRPFYDPSRPLTPFLTNRGVPYTIFHCPADDGITGETEGAGTGRRTAFEAFGTSYYAVPTLFNARLAGIPDADRGVRLSEIATVPSRVVVMGNPIWSEIRYGTGLDAAWHGDPDKGNLLFLDGSVKYMAIPPRNQTGPAVFRPWIRQHALTPPPLPGNDP